MQKGAVQEMAALFLALSLLPPEGGAPKGRRLAHRSGLKKECEMYLSRFVIPSAAEGSFSFPISVFLRKAVCMKHRTPKSHEACFPFPALLTAFA